MQTLAKRSNPLPPMVPHARRDRLADRVFHGLAAGSALLVLLIILGIGAQLLAHSQPALGHFGTRFFTADTWNPVTEEFGGIASLYGTLVATALAMLLATPLAFVIALFLVELAPPSVSSIVGGAIELLAAIPSIIFGIWGLFVFAPLMSDYVQPTLQEILGPLPILGPLVDGPPMGIGMLTAGIILALMILPYMSAVIRDVLRMIPPVLKESAHGLGATTWEYVRKVAIPYGFRGILGALFLGLGRAFGETMAVTFVIGNDHNIATSLFEPGTTIAATLANEFSEATAPLHSSALIELGLILFVISLLFQSVAQLWLSRLNKTAGATR